MQSVRRIEKRFEGLRRMACQPIDDFVYHAFSTPFLLSLVDIERVEFGKRHLVNRVRFHTRYDVRLLLRQYPAIFRTLVRTHMLLSTIHELTKVIMQNDTNETRLAAWTKLV
jgi:hypothetical protein